MKPSDHFKKDPGAEKLLQEVISFTEAPEPDLLRDIDKPSARPNDRRMTDLNRQQVTDMLAASEAKVDARLANFDTGIKTGFAELATAMARQSAAIEKQTDSLRIEMAQMRTEMAKQSGDLRTGMETVRSETHKGTIDLIKWVVGTVLVVATASISILTFIINNVGSKSAATAPAQQQAPVVVAVPAGSTLLSAPQAPATAPVQPTK